MDLGKWGRLLLLGFYVVIGKRFRGSKFISRGIDLGSEMGVDLGKKG
ncbi:hypothetical protein [Staphylococcus haemolyticus]|nr:hypothetical protein [Staphylococcus haemolyticus]